MGRTESSGDNPRRRADAVVTLDNFAHRKGVTKAIQKFRQRKERKRTETAMALRQYKKTMKQQGYQPGKGASRKRQWEQSNETEAHSGDEGATGVSKPTKMPEEASQHDEESSPQQQKRGKKKHHKSNPFQKSILQAQEKQQQIAKAQEQRVEREKEREAKLKQRRKRSKLLRQRTSKGQPVMKHVIHDILAKLEQEQQQPPNR